MHTCGIVYKKSYFSPSNRNVITSPIWSINDPAGHLCTLATSSLGGRAAPLLAPGTVRLRIAKPNTSKQRLPTYRRPRRTRPAMSATHSSNPMPSVTTSLHDDEGLPTTPPNIDTNVPPEGTPLTGKHASSLPFTSTHILRDERVTAMRFEISGRVVGPVPAREFLDRYLPGENTPPLLLLDPEAQTRMTKLTQEMKEVGKETNMYGIWVIITVCRSFCI